MQGHPFVIDIFDYDGPKPSCDHNGHGWGHENLTCVSRLICHVFRHGPIFRIGGDEFVTTLHGDDFAHRDQLPARFCARQHKTCRTEVEPWRQVRVSLGIAVHDPATDASVTDTMRRADKTMYENKERRKAQART